MRQQPLNSLGRRGLHRWSNPGSTQDLSSWKNAVIVGSGCRTHPKPQPANGCRLLLKESRLPLPWKVAASGFFCLVISSSCPGTNSPVVHESKSPQAIGTTALWELSLRVAAVDPDAH